MDSQTKNLDVQPPAVGGPSVGRPVRRLRPLRLTPFPSRPKTATPHRHSFTRSCSFRSSSMPISAASGTPKEPKSDAGLS